MTDSSRTKRAIIIGGGLGGLAAGLRLQCAGWQATILEAGPTFGGKMNRWTSQGFTFDTGPSLITMPWAFEETFAAAGSSLAEHVAFHPLDPIAEYRFHDGTRFEYSSQVPSLLKLLQRIAPKDIDAFFRFLHLGSRLFAVSQATFFRKTPFEAPGKADFPLLRHMPFRHAWGNYATTVEALFESPYLRQLFHRYPTYVGSSPYRSPSTLLVVPYVEFAFGGYYVTGGLYKIVEGLLALCRKHNVVLRPETRVARILQANGRATGVETASGEQISADVVISNGDSAALPELLGTGKPDMRNRSMSGLVFLFGIDKELPEIHPHTVMFSADYQQEFRQIFDEQRFPDDPTVYVNVPSRTDRSLAPTGGETLFVMANAPGCDTVWTDEMVARARARVMQRLRHAGFPDFERNIVTSDVFTPTRIAQRYLMPGGSIYGLDSHGWKNAFLRPGNANPRIPGLYHVGGSTHPGGGTPTVLMSAAITTRLILEREQG